jgi:putative membrane protein
MQSIWYRLTHRPCNLDDCLDLARTVPITEARLDLRYHDPIREEYPLTQFLAQFELKQGDSVRTIEELCGGYLYADSNDKKLSEVNRANARLRQLVNRLSDQGVTLSTSDQQFEYHPSPRNNLATYSNPYERFADTDLILRDQLAIDRTVLANERTFLAYCRTALALVLTGAGCIKFFDSRLSGIAGWTLIGFGLAVTVIGCWRTSRMAHNIGSARRQSEQSPVQRSEPSQR